MLAHRALAVLRHNMPVHTVQASTLWDGWGWCGLSVTDKVHCRSKREEDLSHKPAVFRVYPIARAGGKRKEFAKKYPDH